MSHYLVLVVGDNVEEQLAPYDENLKVKPFLNEEMKPAKIIEAIKRAIKKKYYEDETEILQRWIDFYEEKGWEALMKKHRHYINKVFMESWYGELIAPDGKVYSTYNKNAKWDWYQIGGRWADCLRLKRREPTEEDIEKIEAIGLTFEEVEKIAEKIKNNEDIGGDRKNLPALKLYYQAIYPKGGLGEPSLLFDNFTRSPGRCDIAKKGDIDTESKETELKETAAELWEKWQEVKEKDEDTRKKFLTESLGFLHTKRDVELLNTMTKDEYTECHGTWAPYALLWNDTWYSRGDMGWWGISYNEENQWKGTFKELWNQIPDDETITAVDCHI